MSSWRPPLEGRRAEDNRYVSLHEPRSIDAGEVERGRGDFGQGVANAAAERVDQVFFGMAIGRLVDPLAAAALPAVVSERVLEARAPRVDQEVAGVQEQLDGVEPVQDQVKRPASEVS